MVQSEYTEIKTTVDEDRRIGTATWPEVLKPGIRNRVFLAMTLQFFQQWTGINVILYYQGMLFKGMGIDPKAAEIPLTLASNFINFLATFPGLFLIEKWGRRGLLLYGGFGMGACHFLVCLFVGLSKTNPSYSWVITFIIFDICYCVRYVYE